MSDVNWSEFLRPGERLLWTGHPSRKLVHPAWGDLTSLIMLAVPGYLIFDLAGSPNRGLGEYLFLSLFIILFGGVSIGWIPYNRNLRRHTFYALTDRRVVIRTGIRNPRNHVHELEAWDLPETFFDSADSGTIVFDAGRRLSKATGSLVEGGRRGVNNIQFYKIAELQRVEFLVDQVVQRKRRETEAGAEPPATETGTPISSPTGLSSASPYLTGAGLAGIGVEGGVDWVTDLQPGEQTLWAGRPSRRPIIFSCSDIFMVPFFGMFFYFTLTEALGSFETFEPEDAMLGLFVVITGYLSVGKFFDNWWRRYRTRYVLTNRRALIRTGPVRLRTHFYGLNPLEEVTYDISHDGSGTIVFTGHGGLVERRSRRRNGSSDNAIPIQNVAAQGLERFEFYRIPDAEYVQSLIEDSLDRMMPNRRQPLSPGDNSPEAPLPDVTDDSSGQVSERWAPQPADRSQPARRSLREIPPPPGFGSGESAQQ